MYLLLNFLLAHSWNIAQQPAIKRSTHEYDITSPCVLFMGGTGLMGIAHDEGLTTLNSHPTMKQKIENSKAEGIAVDWATLSGEFPEHCSGDLYIYISLPFTPMQNGSDFVTAVQKKILFQNELPSVIKNTQITGIQTFGVYGFTAFDDLDRVDLASGAEDVDRILKLTKFSKKPIQDRIDLGEAGRRMPLKLLKQHIIHRIGTYYLSWLSLDSETKKNAAASFHFAHNEGGISYQKNIPLQSRTNGRNYKDTIKQLATTALKFVGLPLKKIPVLEGRKKEKQKKTEEKGKNSKQKKKERIAFL